MLCFLSGLPRSGSTLLGALLSQRPDTFVSATSGLIDIMGAAVQTWERNPTTKAQGSSKDEVIRILRAIADAKYADKNESIIIDKSRGWPAPQIMKTMEKVLGKPPKIIATARPIAECLASFAKLVKPEDIRNFCRKSQLANHLFSSYRTLKAAWEADPDNILFVEYDNIVSQPQIELDRIVDFLGIKRFKHFFENIENPLKEKDEEAWNIKGLHDIRPSLKKQEYSAKDILGEQWEHYQGGEFWLDKPEPERKPQLIDLQLEAGLRGDFEKGWKIAQQLEKERPNDDRAAFNRGWYLLKQGRLQEGHKLLDRGRNEDVFGNRHIGTGQPIWNGDKAGHVLLNLEGGLGDQINGVRFAKDIAARGNKVIVSCSGELAPLFTMVEGVSSVVQHEAALGTYHDAWVPSMSAVVPLGYEYKDLNGSPYIPCPITIDIKKRKRIGLCWRGNPKFEHEQHRVFPSDLFFDAVKNADAEFISLQKGKGEDERPEWVNKVPLDTWGNTKEAINKCDLVISSCTSVAHLAGAMGIKTWIITPILPYYLWALPGEKTPYYDSVTLFRQEKYGDWTAPFEKIKEKLEKGISKQSTEKTKTSANSAYYPEVFSVQNLEQAKNSILTDENDENKWDIETKLSVEKLIKAFSVTKDSILLDYGCGIGRIAKELIKQTDCTIIGVDSSPNMLKLSNDYVDSKNFTPCSVRNLKKLIETGLKFDAAFSILVLQHSLNPRQDIALIHYALRNEGFFYLLNENKRFLPTKSLDSNFVKWRDDGKNVAKLTEEKFVEIEDLPFKHLISKVYLKK
ncbi:hypothetical protein CMO93_06090 [Candidatus Woesearchaeota archaeon]|nr:hypothetical protein [Candidatus Woesearchaeota archaeon]|tara:strand:+ start:94 stop:2481 length:2388 start_codon:yes stop_codon:yes gene_type:complete